MFSDTDPKVLELSKIVLAQLICEHNNVVYTNINCAKTIVQSDVNILCARYIMEVLDKWLDRYGIDWKYNPIPSRNFTQFIMYVYDGTITEKQAKEQVFPYMWDNNLSPEWAILDLKILQSKNKYDLDSIISKLTSENPKQVEQFQAGNEKIVGFFMGRIMKETDGCFDPNTIKEILISKLRL